MDRLWIEITTGHCLGGQGNDVYPGDRLMAPRDLTLPQARAKIQQGYAKEIPEPVEEKPEKVVPGSVVHADPEPDDRDPEITSANRPRAGRRTR